VEAIEIKPSEPMVQDPPNRFKQFQITAEKIQKAFRLTQEVMENPEPFMKKRQLPKSGIEPLDFETDQYLQD
jgi:hypothetical protein